MKKAIKKKEVKELIKTVFEQYDLEFSKKDKFELDDNVVLINGESKFFYYEKKLVPTLRFILKNSLLKTITVDMGAVPYAAKGVDMMRPGITEFDEDIEKNEFIVIVDETHKKPIAIGLTLFSGQEIKDMKTGKIVKNIHYVGDNIWNSA